MVESFELNDVRFLENEVADGDRTARRPRRTREQVIASQSRNYVEKFILDTGHTACRRFEKGDRLIWTDPQSGAETKVTAAAGESDGLVVVKQNGTRVPCPVDQVRRVKRAAPAGRK
jgi:hypothetical protein